MATEPLMTKRVRKAFIRMNKAVSAKAPPQTVMEATGAFMEKRTKQLQKAARGKRKVAHKLERQSRAWRYGRTDDEAARAAMQTYHQEKVR